MNKYIFKISLVFCLLITFIQLQASDIVYNSDHTAGTINLTSQECMNDEYVSYYWEIHTTPNVPVKITYKKPSYMMFEAYTYYNNSQIDVISWGYDPVESFTTVTTIAPPDGIIFLDCEVSSWDLQDGKDPLSLSFEIDNSFNLSTGNFFQGNTIISGNLGIGTATPKCNLDVKGDARILGGKKLIFGDDLSGNVNWIQSDGQGLSLYAGSKQGVRLTDASVGLFATSNLTFNVNSKSAIYINYQGRVGLGRAPNSEATDILQVYNSSNPSFQIFDATNYGLQIGIAASNTCFATGALKGDAVFRARGGGDILLNIMNSSGDGSRSIKFGDEKNGVFMKVSNDKSLRLDGAFFTKEIHFFSDDKGSGTDNSDPYTLRKVHDAGNVSHLDLNLNDDGDESFRIYGNSCNGYNCGIYSGNLYHSFDASGNVYHAGNVGIGVTSPQHKLDVKGTICADEVLVKTVDWPDFVFDENYKLRDLKEVDQFIQENGHLPEIPSTAEVKEKGVNIVEVQAKLLQKLEELTLYTIQLKKEIEQLKAAKK